MTPLTISKEAREAAERIQNRIKALNQEVSSCVYPGTDYLSLIIQSALDNQAKRYEEVVKLPPTNDELTKAIEHVDAMFKLKAEDCSKVLTFDPWQIERILSAARELQQVKKERDCAVAQILNIESHIVSMRGEITESEIHMAVLHILTELQQLKADCKVMVDCIEHTNPQSRFQNNLRITALATLTAKQILEEQKKGR